MAENNVQKEELVEQQPIQPIPSQSIALASEFSVHAALQQWKDYQKLTSELLDANDYQGIGGKQFKKKSAWRKYMRAFNLTEVPEKSRIDVPERDGRFWPLYATAFCVVASPDGREGTGYHECNITEKCCSAALGEECDRDHKHCDSGCKGYKHWSHPGDITATAHTRAKNRAISDWVGAGEVSADEIRLDGNRSAGINKKSKPNMEKCPKCGKSDSVITNKFDGGLLCWEKKGGCGEKFGKTEKKNSGKVAKNKNDNGTNPISRVVSIIADWEVKFREAKKQDIFKSCVLEVIGNRQYFEVEEMKEATDLLNKIIQHRKAVEDH